MTITLIVSVNVDKGTCSETDKSIKVSVRDAVNTAMDTALQEGFEHGLQNQIEITGYDVSLP